MNILMSELGPDQTQWLQNGVIVLACLGAAAYYVLGSIEKIKNLRGGNLGITTQPLAVVVEKSLSEKFVDRPRFEKFEEYVHKAHHDIKGEVHAVKVEGEGRGEKLERFIHDLDAANEKRMDGLYKAIHGEGKRLDERVNSVLTAVSRVEGAFEQSQRRRT